MNSNISCKHINPYLEFQCENQTLQPFLLKLQLEHENYAYRLHPQSYQGSKNYNLLWMADDILPVPKYQPACK